MVRSAKPAASLCTLALLAIGGPIRAPGADLLWSQLEPLPVSAEITGSCVMVISGTLVVAGGAPRGSESGEDSRVQPIRNVWILDAPEGSWRATTPLPEPLAFSACAALEDFAMLAGGIREGRLLDSAYRVRLDQGDAVFEPLPALPEPRAYAAATALDSVFYLAGGRTGPSSANGADMLMLNLQAEEPAWELGPAWPGPGRMLASFVAQDGALFLFGGAALPTSGNASNEGLGLQDAYRFSPAAGWTRITSPPGPIVGVPAAALGPTHIALFGGEERLRSGGDVPVSQEAPRLTPPVRGYHTVTDTWVEFGRAPGGIAGRNATVWQDRLVVPLEPGGSNRERAGVWTASVASAPSGFSSVDYVTLFAYFSVLVAMGLYFASKGSSTDEFFLAGGRMPWWATGLSIFGTQLSSISFMAVPAKVYATDWVYFLLQMTIVLVAFPVVFFYLPYFRRAKMTSAYEYLENRFNLPVRLYASVSFVLYQLGRMAIVLFLPAIALSTVTGVSVYACILLMGTLSTLYTVMGGIKAVIWTDVVQVFVLYGGALLSLLILLARTDGGLAGIVAAGLDYDKFHMFNWTWDWTTTAVWVVLVGNLFLNLVPYTSDQAVVQRYFTTKDEKAAARSIWTNAILIVPSTLTLFLLGTGLWAFYRANPELLDPALPTDSIFPLFIAQQLPVGIAGLLIAAVFAASMSTLDSSLNSVSAAVVTDFFVRFRPGSSDAARLLLARCLTGGLGAVATATSIALATFDIGSLWDTFQGMMGLLGGGLAGLFALGIFFRRANGGGAMAGAIASVFILYWVQQRTDLHFFLYGAVGILSCIGIGLLASAFFAPRRAAPGSVSKT